MAGLGFGERPAIGGTSATPIRSSPWQVTHGVVLPCTMSCTTAISSRFVGTATGRATYSEAGFAYLNRSARTDVAQVRELLDAWFARYSSEHQPELASRFRAAGRRGLEPPFFELFLHELLLRLGFRPTVHPQLASTERRPDFLVESDGATSFLLEAAVVSDEPREETAARRLEDGIYDSLNDSNRRISS